MLGVEISDSYEQVRHNQVVASAEPLSEYEKQRLENMAANQEHLVRLGLA